MDKITENMNNFTENACFLLKNGRKDEKNPEIFSPDAVILMQYSTLSNRTSSAAESAETTSWRRQNPSFSAV